MSSGARRVWVVAGPYLSALAAGIYWSRIGCEALPGVRSWAQIALSLALGLGAGSVLTLLLRRLRLQSWPLLVLGVYACWPLADGRIASATALVSVVAILVSSSPSLPLPAWLAEASAAAVSLALYVVTLAPSVQAADAGEFQLVAATLGIAHPPGYPLYTLLGKAFTLVPWGDVAWRVNLFAAVCATVAVAVVCRCVRERTGSAAAGLAAAAMLGFAPTFWAQGTVANIRSLTALLTALLLHSLLRWGDTRSPRDLAAAATVFGLSALHHTSLLMLAPALLAYVLAVDARLLLQPRRWLAPALGMGSTLLIIAYLPLRSMMGPAFDSPVVRTPAGLFSHVLGLGFQGDLLYYLSHPGLSDRLLALWDILNVEFGSALFLGALTAGAAAARRHAAQALLWGSVAALNAFAAITYRAPQTVEYLMPTYVALALALGLGLGVLQTARALRPAAALAVGLCLALAIDNGRAAYPSFAALHSDGTVRRDAEALLAQAPADALILANWHQATPLWYLQIVEGRRRDVQVVYVYPEGSTPNGEVWARRVLEGMTSRPVLVTNRYAELEALPCHWQPVAGGWQALARPPTSPPQSLQGQAVTLGERFELLGMAVDGATASPGRSVRARLAWRALLPLDHDYSWSVQLLGPDGVAGQADRTYSMERVRAGDVWVDDYVFTLRPDAAPGEYSLVAGVYYAPTAGGWQRLRAPDGRDMIRLAALSVQVRRDLPPTAHPGFIAWSDGSQLRGIDWDDSAAAHRRLYLHWFRPARAAALDLVLLSGDAAVGQARLGPQAEAGYRTVACDLPAGIGEVRLQAHAGEVPVLPLAAWRRPAGASLHLPRAKPGARYLDLGGEMALVHATWEPQPPEAGASLRAELLFVAARPLVRDYSISLDLSGENWRTQNDGTPALGAIPTLKWLAGWRVRDVRRLALPREAQGTARLGLAVYDAFTLAHLPVGDDRLMRAGEGLRAILWRGEVVPAR
ncbi:MAG: protein O-mannosyl-transferase family [Anaerolineae bacterium]